MPLRSNNNAPLFQERIPQLDSLRGIAILMVVGFHFTSRYQQIYGHSGPLLFEVPDGYLGVKLFFLISGFVICMSLSRKLRVLDFWVFRFSRLFPVYWCAVLLTHMTVLMFSLPGREISTYAALVNLSMLQEWLSVSHVDQAYWVLTVELSFYSIMGAIFSLKQEEKLESITALWIGCMISIAVIENFNFFRVPPIVKTSLLLEHGNLLFAGVIFYRIHHHFAGKKSYLLLLFALSAEFIVHGIRSGIVCCLFFSILYFVGRRVGFINTLLSVKPLVFMGAISYSYYLVHQNIGYIVLKELYKMNFSPTQAILLAIIATMTVAVGLTTVVENPVREKVKASWLRYRENRL